MGKVFPTPDQYDSYNVLEVQFDSYNNSISKEHSKLGNTEDKNFVSNNIIKIKNTNINKRYK